MNLKLSIPAATLVATSILGGTLLPLQRTSAQAPTSTPTPTPTTTAAAETLPPPVIQYECFDNNGKIAFTTINPQDTYGWALGCREVPYIDNRSLESQVTYYQCFDLNGNIAFTTVDKTKSDNYKRSTKLSCREIGKRDSSPVQTYAIYYECLNTSGQIAFATAYPQDTYGWKPGCREMITRNFSAPQGGNPTAPQ